MGGTEMCSSSSVQSDAARGDPHDDSGEQPTCSFLSVGQAFEGTQNVSDGMQLLGCKEEAWRVNVRLHSCDLRQVRGSELTALPVAGVKSHQSHVTHSRTKPQGGTTSSHRH
jgi:hypothetical protein